MHTVTLERPDDFDGWRMASRQALMAGVTPEHICFLTEGETGSLFEEETQTAPVSTGSVGELRVPKAFVDLARQTLCHSDPQRFVLLYRLLYRLQVDRQLLMKTVDPDVHRANVLAKEVRRDVHKMKAFVRFRKVGDDDQFVAWFEPTHHIVRLAAPFFTRRFSNMVWSILTPFQCAHWTGTELSFSPGVSKNLAPEEDALEDFWRSYYASIFNPARLKTDAMQSEMPKKYWKNLPEAALIPDLVQQARSREQQMREADPSMPNPAMMAHREIAPEFSAPSRDAITSLADVRTALTQCQACPLWKPATQAVPGRGGTGGLMMVGEQPGDREDLEGVPFIGPAGQLLQTVLDETGIDREKTYVTNAVKHFKFQPRGKRRIHQNPRAGEIDACRWWLQKEIELVAPKVIVALGASAVRGITGRPGKIGELRGSVHLLAGGVAMVVTRHPASILRTPDGSAREEAMAQLRADIGLAARALAASSEQDQDAVSAASSRSASAN